MTHSLADLDMRDRLHLPPRDLPNIKLKSRQNAECVVDTLSELMAAYHNVREKGGSIAIVNDLRLRAISIVAAALDEKPTP